ncbi:MAG: hypothetical protein LBI85_02695 [Spirochaetaceae bacterium]|jgi:hypothetical protein|nr:hypothetical protein [Spirochaetaceae bacterium]
MTRKFTPEEKEIIHNVRSIRKQIQREMKGMTQAQQLEYMNNLNRKADAKKSFQISNRGSMLYR